MRTQHGDRTLKRRTDIGDGGLGHSVGVMVVASEYQHISRQSRWGEANILLLFVVHNGTNDVEMCKDCFEIDFFLCFRNCL